MKNLLFVFLVFQIFISCKEDIIGVEQPILDIEGSYIRIDEVKDYLPDEYFNESRIIYVDSIGNERILNTNAGESVEQLKFKDMNYKSDKFVVSLYDELQLDFNITISGNAGYINDGLTISKGILFWLMPFNQRGSTLTFFNFKEGKPYLYPGRSFIDSIDLYSNTFYKVLKVIGKDNNQKRHPIYSELILNSDVGIVAFRDKNDDLWVFDRFIE